VTVFLSVAPRSSSALAPTRHFKTALTMVSLTPRRRPTPEHLANPQIACGIGMRLAYLSAGAARLAITPGIQPASGLRASMTRWWMHAGCCTCLPSANTLAMASLSTGTRLLVKQTMSPMAEDIVLDWPPRHVIFLSQGGSA